MRWQLAIAVPLVLVGCTPRGGHEEQRPGASNNQPTQQVANERASSEPSKADSNGPPAVNNAVLRSADTAVRYLGTWASSKANCKSKPWRFRRDSLDVANGPRCSFYNVAKVPGGYDIAAQCPTKQPVREDLIKLRFAESAKAMLVESNAISPTGLVYCSS